MSAAFRIGQGYDIHRLVPGRPCVLGGVKIPSELGPEGHSDADVLLHALTDAILGALGEGDIGTHFPPSDPTWKGAASERFLRHAASLARRAGYRVGNLDATVICETPRLGPHIGAIGKNIAGILGVGAGNVSVKATTHEGLGPLGRREAIACHAVALLARGE